MEVFNDLDEIEQRSLEALGDEDNEPGDATDIYYSAMDVPYLITEIRQLRGNQ